jgi:acetyltransferase EpsM
MYKKKIIIIGTGSQAKLICEGILKNNFVIKAFYDDFSGDEKRFFNFNKKKFPILKKIELLNKYINKNNYFICCIGKNFLREKIISNFEKIYPLIKWYTYIAKTAQISNSAIIGKGSMVMDGVIINSFSKIGNHSIINTGCIVEHDNFFKNFVSLGPGVKTGGNVLIGCRSHIGTGSVIKNNIAIRRDAVIGIGSVVVKDCSSSKIYFGVPAKKIKNRKKNDNYL